MSNHQAAAQAVRFIDALHDQLVKMTAQLAWIERQDVTARNARAYAMRVEAAALRQDIQQAQFLIDGLARRYLGRNGTEIVSRASVSRRPR